MASTLKVDKIQSASGANALEIDASGGVTFPNSSIVAENDFAHFASTSTYTITSSTTGQLVPFNTVIHSNGITYNTTNNTWQHSQTGYFKLQHQFRQIIDRWTILYVNSDTNGSVGVSHRNGSATGAAGLPDMSLIYKVTDTSETFGLYHWIESSSFNLVTHQGSNPSSAIFPTPEFGTSPTTGYYNTILITKV